MKYHWKAEWRDKQKRGSGGGGFTKRYTGPKKKKKNKAAASLLSAAQRSYRSLVSEISIVRPVKSRVLG